MCGRLVGYVGEVVVVILECDCYCGSGFVVVLGDDQVGFVGMFGLGFV